MDTLTFNTPLLLRHLTFSEAKKQPILEVDLKKALDGLDMTMSQVLEETPLVATFSDNLFLQFIELCLLLGCDYLEPIKGIGPKTAYKLMQEHGSLGKVLEHLRAKYVHHEQRPKVARLTGRAQDCCKTGRRCRGGEEKKGRYPNTRRMAVGRSKEALRES